MMYVLNEEEYQKLVKGNSDKTKVENAIRVFSLSLGAAVIRLNEHKSPDRAYMDALRAALAKAKEEALSVIS